MKFRFIVIVVFISINGTSADLFANVSSVVNDFVTAFTNFITTGIATGCASFADAYNTETNVTSMIANFSTGIETQFLNIETELPSRVSQISSDYCGLLNNYTTSVIDQFQNFTADVTGYVDLLVGQPDKYIHRAFCGQEPGTVWDYYTNALTVFNNQLNNLNGIINELCAL